MLQMRFAYIFFSSYCLFPEASYLIPWRNRLLSSQTLRQRMSFSSSSFSKHVLRQPSGIRLILWKRQTEALIPAGPQSWKAEIFRNVLQKMHKLPSRRTDFALDFENDQVSVSEVSLASRESEAKGMVSEGACTDTMPSISCQARGSSKVNDFWVSDLCQNGDAEVQLLFRNPF